MRYNSIPPKAHDSHHQKKKINIISPKKKSTTHIYKQPINSPEREREAQARAEIFLSRLRETSSTKLSYTSRSWNIGIYRIDFFFLYTLASFRTRTPRRSTYLCVIHIYAILTQAPERLGYVIDRFDRSSLGLAIAALGDFFFFISTMTVWLLSKLRRFSIIDVSLSFKSSGFFIFQS